MVVFSFFSFCVCESTATTTHYKEELLGFMSDLLTLRELASFASFFFHELEEFLLSFSYRTEVSPTKLQYWIHPFPYHLIPPLPK